jgi:thioredoxin reductase
VTSSDQARSSRARGTSAGAGALRREDRERLADAGIAVDRRAPVALVGPGRSLTAVEFAEGRPRPCAGLLVPGRLHQRSDLPRQLGVDLVAGPLGDEHVGVGPMQEAAPGVFAAGDVLPTAPSVPAAIASGTAAAAGVVHSLQL